MQSPRPPFADQTSLRRTTHFVVLGLAHVIGFVALDWISFIHPLQVLNITPWNPAPALSIALLLTAGMRYAGIVFLSVFIAEYIVRGLPMHIAFTVFSSALLAAGYTAIAWVLKSRLRLQPGLRDRRNWTRLIAAIVAGDLVLGCAYVFALATGTFIPSRSFFDALLRFWIGDVVGILLILPLVLALCDAGRRRDMLRVLGRLEVVPQVLAIVLAVWLVFGLGTANPFKYFYAIFLPLVWVAARHGTVGAVIAVALIQIGVIASVELTDLKTVTVFELQALLLALGLTGFFLGVTVDERRAAAEKLSQTVRLAAAGEMAAALAHEINQPLTAIATYGRACQLMAQGGQGQHPELVKTLERMLVEARRAGEVVKRLRDFFLSGETRTERVGVTDLLEDLRPEFAERASALGAEFEIASDPELPPVEVDRLQFAVVLRNLFQNALDSVASVRGRPKGIQIMAAADGQGRIRFTVLDSGPGITPARLQTLFEPFVTTKAQGMGLGLPVSRAIVEAHGGELTAEAGEHGIFHISLPINQKHDDTDEPEPTHRVHRR